MSHLIKNDITISLLKIRKNKTAKFPKIPLPETVEEWNALKEKVAEFGVSCQLVLKKKEVENAEIFDICKKMVVSVANKLGFKSELDITTWDSGDVALRMTSAPAVDIDTKYAYLFED